MNHSSINRSLGISAEGSPVRRALMLLMLMAVAAAVGCSPGPVQKPDWGNIVWPLPPEEPKIKFVEVLQSSSDVEESESFTKSLFGEEEEMGLMRPYGIGADKDGNVYVTDTGAVFVFDRKSKKFRIIGGEAGVGKLSKPANVAISKADGRIVVSDTVDRRIYIYDRTGKYITALGHKGEFERPIGVAIDDSRQRLYVVDSKKQNVRAYRPDGTVAMTIEGKGKTGEFYFHTPTHIALDSHGNIYVVDTQDFQIKIFDPDGKLLRVVGTLGDSPGDFVRPKGIAFDSDDNMYVVDTAFQNVQIFTKEGRLLMYFGGGSIGFRPGRFVLPAGIAIDGDDRIYVVDQFTSLVQVYQYMGNRWKQREAEQKAAPKPEQKTDQKKTQ